MPPKDDDKGITLHAFNAVSKQGARAEVCTISLPCLVAAWFQLGLARFLKQQTAGHL
jgi:hypothetical protein